MTDEENTKTLDLGDAGTVVVEVGESDAAVLKAWKIDRFVHLLYEKDKPHAEIFGPACPYRAGVTSGEGKPARMLAGSPSEKLVIPFPKK